MPSDFSLPAQSGIVVPEPGSVGDALPVGGGAEETPDSRLWLRLTAASPRSYRTAFGVVAAALAALFAMIVVHGPVLQVYYGHDDMGFLAFAWKIRNGVFPNADFHIALGALNCWIHAAGMWLFGPTAAILPYCNGLVALGIAWLAWTLAAARLPAVLAGIFAFTQGVVAMSPHLMRFEWFGSTYDCYYNRQDFAILSVVMLTVFLPPTRPDDRRGEPRDDRFLGAILGALLFLKITFFMSAGGLLVLGYFTARQPRRLRSPNLLVALGLAVLLCLPMIRFDVRAVIGDLAMAAQAKNANPDAAITVSKVIWWLRDAWVEILFLGLAQAALRSAPIFQRSHPEVAATAPSWLEFLAVIGMTVLLNITNAGGGVHSETPLLTSWMFVLAGYAVRPRGDAPTLAPLLRPQGRAVGLTCVLAGILWFYTFGIGLFCLGYSTWPWPSQWVKTALAESPAFDSPSLASLRIIENGGESVQPKTYADKINDGLTLLRRLGGVHRVNTLDFNNPFPFALLWPPPRGDFWTWHDGASFDMDTHPTFAGAFGDADVIMVPKYAGELNSVRTLKRLYKGDLAKQFALTMESEQWYLYVRR